MKDQQAHEVVIPKSVALSIGGREFEIRPFTFMQRTRIYQLLVPASLNLSGSDRSALESGKGSAQLVLNLIIEMFPEMVMMALQREPEWVDANLDPEAEDRLIEAIKEVNDLPLLFSRLPKVTGLFGSKSESSTTSPAA